MWPIGHWPGSSGSGTTTVNGLATLPGVDLVDVISLVASDDYRRRDERSIIVERYDYEDWPDLDGTISAIFTINGADGFTRPCAILSADSIDFEIFASHIPAAGKGFFEIEMVRSNGSIITLRKGTVTIERP